MAEVAPAEPTAVLALAAVVPDELVDAVVGSVVSDAAVVVLAGAAVVVVFVVGFVVAFVVFLVVEPDVGVWV